MTTFTEWLTRLWGTLRGRRMDADLEQELRLHLELAAEDARRRGLAGDEALRAAHLGAGGVAQAMESLRDQRGLPWMESLKSDAVFGWRHLRKNPRTSAAAVLSLALAIGATMAAFRLLDAVLLRPMPVKDPQGLFAIGTTFLDNDLEWDLRELFDYPAYRENMKVVDNSADLMVLGMASPVSVRFRAGDTFETGVFHQYVSGNVFGTFGLVPALGRLISPQDDQTPGAHPVAVLSHHYWRERLGGDPNVVGQSIFIGRTQHEIIGVGPKGFTGTEPGSMTAVFVPAMMNKDAINNPSWTWFRMWVRPRPGVSPMQVQQMLQGRHSALQAADVKNLASNTPKERLDAFLNEEVRLLPAGSGVSDLKDRFKTPLVILIGLAAMVLLMASVNVASTLTGQSLARQHEMALRISIGATRARLVQLVMVESALLAIMSSGLAILFASWVAPFVVSMLASSDRPVRLVLDLDWRTLSFGVAVTLIVMIIAGLAPALRASAAMPVGALKSEQSREQRRLTSVLVVSQVAFSFILLFVAGLFVTSFGRLSTRSLGFSHEQLLQLEVRSGKEQSIDVWTGLINDLKQVPGIEAAALAGWGPLTGNRWTGIVRGADRTDNGSAPYFLDISHGYFETMKIRMLDGRDFRRGDRAPGMDAKKQPIPGVGVVNEAFARTYFGGANPVGRRVNVGRSPNDLPMEIVGLVGDAAYMTVQEPMQPTVYVPVESRSDGTLMVRTTGDPAVMGEALRRKISELRADLVGYRARPQSLFVNRQMLRERLLATLSLFFGVVALLLAVVGLYGVVNAAVIRQQREIGIRMALGARRPQIIRRVVAGVAVAACAGAAIGLGAGLAAGWSVEGLLFQVGPTDLLVMLAPGVALAAGAVLATLPPVIRAVRTSPVIALKE